MPHPPAGLLIRLSRLLEPPVCEAVIDALLSAALVPGARQLTPLVLLVDRDIRDQFDRTFSKGAALDDRHQVAAILRELATHDATHARSCGCVPLGRSLGPFAFALTGVEDPFYRRLGEILLDDVVRELDPAADPRRTDVGPAWAIRQAPAGEPFAT
jgi:hypothetical protein